ncbi:hypothetical protein B0T18DRAFT_317886 [Schizothecium vesticola]|uniref:Uncharacterized protein n=1 Tax=Schizothecium vesticola TaxID=314040 RepID=A0AA40F6E1_9PEZI|nr:hypothetical protein B0T18DRAFT_317886 [Schizothecium vesticola]
MRKRRIDLQARRHQTDRADNEFMQIIRPLLVALSPVALPTETIRERLQVLQQAREAYYGAERAYGDQEAQLDHEEHHLHALELELQRFLDDQRGDENDASSSGTEPDHVNDNSDKRDEVDPTSNSSYILLGIDGDRAEDVHPLYQKLLNAAADRELAREHHTEMQRRHDRILQDLEMDLHRERARANRGSQLSDGELLSLKLSLTGFPSSVEEFKRKFRVPIDQDDLEFLRDYEVDVETVRRVMEAANYEVFRLKALCDEKGAMRKNPPYEEEFTIVKGTSMALRLPEGNMALNHQPAPNLSHPIFSTLLSNPMHVLEQKTPMAALKEVMQMPKDSPGAALGRINCMKELGISRLMQKPENKTDFINQWLIHRLRTSPMEVELLFSISTGFLRIMNLRRWQEDVLAHWKTDDAAGTLGPIPEASRTTSDKVAVDDGIGESDGSDGSGSSEGDDLLQRARSDDEGAQSHSRRSGAKLEVSTKSSPLL